MKLAAGLKEKRREKERKNIFFSEGGSKQKNDVEEN